MDPSQIWQRARDLIVQELRKRQTTQRTVFESFYKDGRGYAAPDGTGAVNISRSHLLEVTECVKLVAGLPLPDEFKDPVLPFHIPVDVPNFYWYTFEGTEVVWTGAGYYQLRSSGVHPEMSWTRWEKTRDVGTHPQFGQTLQNERILVLSYLKRHDYMGEPPIHGVHQFAPVGTITSDPVFIQGTPMMYFKDEVAEMPASMQKEQPVKKGPMQKRTYTGPHQVEVQLHQTDLEIENVLNSMYAKGYTIRQQTFYNGTHTFFFYRQPPSEETELREQLAMAKADAASINASLAATNDIVASLRRKNSELVAEKNAIRLKQLDDDCKALCPFCAAGFFRYTEVTTGDIIHLQYPDKPSDHPGQLPQKCGANELVKAYKVSNGR